MPTPTSKRSLRSPRWLSSDRRAERAAPAIDYEIGNWYTSQHPSSHFRHQLVAARTTAEARHGLRDNRLTIRHVGGSIEQRYLSADEIEAALADIFLLTPEPSWRRAIERAATAEIQA